jgi:hypothetical protein
VALLVIVGVLVGIGLVDRRDRDIPKPPSVPEEPGEDMAVPPMPVSPASSAASSTWYCPLGTGSGNDFVSKQTLVLANFGEEPRTATITILPEVTEPAQEPVEQEVELAPRTRQSVDTSGLTEARFTAALVEFDGGGVSVSESLEGQWGRDDSSCSTVAAPEWHVAAGSTKRGEHLLYTVFNPFSELVNVDITFETEDGTRRPGDLQPLIVPPRSVVAVSVGDIVTDREDVAATFRTRGGRVVVGRAIGYDDQEGVTGLAADLASPTPTETWFFPAGDKGEGIDEEVFVYNPTGDNATVTIQFVVDDPQATGPVPPIELSVGAHEVVVVGSPDEAWGQIPDGGHSIIIRSINEVPVVAERLLAFHDPQPADGAELTAGTPLISTELLLAGASVPGAELALLLLNPSTESIARVTVVLVADGEEEVVVDAHEIPPGERFVMGLSEAVGDREVALRISAEAPVVAEFTARSDDDPIEHYLTRLVPVDSRTEEPAPFGQ